MFQISPPPMLRFSRLLESQTMSKGKNSKISVLLGETESNERSISKRSRLGILASAIERSEILGADGGLRFAWLKKREVEIDTCACESEVPLFDPIQ